MTHFSQTHNHVTVMEICHESMRESQIMSQKRTHHTLLYIFMIKYRSTSNILLMVDYLGNLL